MRTTEVERALLWTAGQVRGELLAEVKDFGRLKHLIEQLERFEVIEAYPQLGDVSDHIRESPVLDCCWIMPSVPHMDWAGDALVSYVVPGPSEWEADKERAKLEAEVTQELPAAVAAAKARLQAYRVAYVALVEARMAHIVEFCLGRFDSADRGHGISRKRRAGGTPGGDAPGARGRGPIWRVCAKSVAGDQSRSAVSGCRVLARDELREGDQGGVQRRVP